MIFVITGTQEPFDRMIKVVDEIAGTFKHLDFVAQVSKSTLKIENLQAFDFIPPVTFNKYFDKADLIISHAGMGTIISALERSIPILIMPRLATYSEHRNDHQVDTCKVFEKLGYVSVAYDEVELKTKIINLLNNSSKPLHKIGKYASDELINSLQEFISEKNLL
jgi:UDP-N-acetylglucosamine transferase subunit ALG13